MSPTTSVRVAPVAALKTKSDAYVSAKKMPIGFNFALAAMIAGSVFTMDAISPEWAEAGRSGGRMGGSSFRSAPRMSAPRGMGGQSRQAPNPGAMRGGGMGMGYGSFMPFPMFSPFGYGMGFGLGGFGFIFQIFALLWVVNFVSSLLASASQPPRNDDDEPPRN